MVKYDQDAPTRRLEAEASYKKQITEQLVPQVEKQKIELEQKKQESMADMTKQIKQLMEEYDANTLKQKDLVGMQYDQRCNRSLKSKLR